MMKQGKSVQRAMRIIQLTNKEATTRNCAGYSHREHTPTAKLVVRIRAPATHPKQRVQAPFVYPESKRAVFTNTSYRSRISISSASFPLSLSCPFSCSSYDDRFSIRRTRSFHNFCSTCIAGTKALVEHNSDTVAQQLLLLYAACMLLSVQRELVKQS